MCKNLLFAALLVLVGGTAVFVGGCAPTRQSADVSAERDGIVFSRDILPLLHSKFKPLLDKDDDLNLQSWDGLMAGSAHGQVVIPYDADGSLLIALAESRESSLTAEEIAMVRAWIEAGARNDAGEVPFADADQLLYVCNQGDASISVIDMEANVVIRTIDLQELGYSENAKPHHAVVAPDGEHFFVSLIGENTVLKFNKNNEIVERVPFEVPGLMTIDPAEEELYVGRSMSAVNAPPRIGVVELGETDVEEMDVFFPRPHAIQLTPDGRYLYVASLGVNQFASIDTETDEIQLHDTPGHHHHMYIQFGITPDGRTMMTGGEMSGQVLYFNISDPMKPELVKTADLGGAPWHPVITPDGRHTYFPRKNADAVSVIDMSNLEETAVITGNGLSQPHGSAIRPDGRYVYISNNNLKGTYTPRYDLPGDPPGTITVIDPRTNEIVKVIEVENYPTGIGTRPSR